MKLTTIFALTVHVAVVLELTLGVPSPEYANVGAKFPPYVALFGMLLMLIAVCTRMTCCKAAEVLPLNCESPL
jgi:hypothetical protein